MSTDAKPRLSTETPSRETPRDEAAGNRLVRANIWVSVTAFGAAAAMAMMQVEVPTTFTTSPTRQPAPIASQCASNAPTGIGMPAFRPRRSAQ